MFNDNILPFNDCFYYNCFHSALFATFKANNGSFLECMISGIPHFEKQTLETKKRILYRFQFLIDYSELILRNGLTCIKVLNECDSLKIIETEILAGAVAIVNVDVWALPYRMDLYHKGYWPHTILVVKADIEKNLFRIIDQPTREAMTFHFYEISSDDLNKAMALFWIRKLNDISYTSENDLIFRATNKPQQIDKIQLRKKWINNITYEREHIFTGINIAKNSLEDFLEILNSPDMFQEEGYFLLEGLNDIVKQKRWILYLAAHLALKNESIIDYSESLLSQWLQLRNYVGHIVFSGKRKNKVLEHFRFKWIETLKLESDAILECINLEGK